MTNLALRTSGHLCSAHECLGCRAPLTFTLIDLGQQPLANGYVTVDRAEEPELEFPLHVRVCEQCLLVQVDTRVPPEMIFNEKYAYHSSYSVSWLDHSSRYAADMIERLQLNAESSVIEIASNDGYLLQYFVSAGIPVLGIEPARGVAEIAEAKGVSTLCAFFGVETATELAREGTNANLLIANNVFAHVPDINDFVAGISILLAHDGVFTVEFPHLLELIRCNQFDTIYHEHFTYLSLIAVQRIFDRHGLAVFDVEQLPTHGGSLRVYVSRRDHGRQPTVSVQRILELERSAGLDRTEGYTGFQRKAEQARSSLVDFLNGCLAAGKTVAAYGAAAKGNTLLNYCRITTTQIPYVVDRNPAKQGMLLPGSHIPIRKPAVLAENPPDYLLILPWNLHEEIASQNDDLRRHGTKFVTAIPELRVF